MTKPAKDEAALLKRVGEAIRKSVIQPGCCMEDTGCQIGPCNCSQEAGEAAIAAIRAAGWAVVPVDPTFNMESEGSVAMVKIGLIPLPGEVAKIYHAMLAAAPGVKP
jgi:hypothetical protein